MTPSSAPRDTLSNEDSAGSEPKNSLVGVDRLRQTWLAEWPEAMTIWSRFTRLREPIWCTSKKAEQAEGLTDSFAMIRLTDHLVVISLRQILQLRLEAYGREILAHEIGHHMMCPANLADHGRLIAQIRRGLPKIEHLAPQVANLYSDLLINHHLQRQAGLNMAGVYQTLGNDGNSRLWNLYMRIYEILWGLPKLQLVPSALPLEMEGDALLGAKLIRVFSKNWLDGAGRFACLLFPYLYEDQGVSLFQKAKVWADTEKTAGDGEMPGGLAELSENEGEVPVHPSQDPLLNETLGDKNPGEQNGVSAADREELLGEIAGKSKGRGQARQPFEYGEILRAIGIQLTPEEVAIRYYREMATPHLIPFPTKEMPKAADPLPEGLDVWDVGSPVDEIDWQSTTMMNPIVIPGVTTMRRVMGTSEGDLPDKIPIDLDLYVDSSGSMPDPRHQISYLTLAGAIITLSALRVGARVQATLWSGKREFLTTNGFVRDETEIMKVLVGFFGGGTAFPIHILRDTYQDRKPTDRKVHIMVISDDGVDTMFDKDEKGNSGVAVSAEALKKCGAGGSLVLNLYGGAVSNPKIQSMGKHGWNIYPISDWESLTGFARNFSRSVYAAESTSIPLKR